MTQGTPTGINSNEKILIGHKGPKEEKKETGIQRVKSSVKKMVSTFVWSASILAVESFVIWAIVNYSFAFDTWDPTYKKVFLLLLMVRLIFRTTILDKSNL
jgi:uncharacterized membrane protein